MFWIFKDQPRRTTVRNELDKMEARKGIVQDMISILNQEQATDEEKHMAASTIVAAYEPH